MCNSFDHFELDLDTKVYLRMRKLDKVFIAKSYLNELCENYVTYNAQDKLNYRIKLVK